MVIRFSEELDLFCIRYSDRTTFCVSKTADEVWAWWPQPLTLEDTLTYLLGPVLGLVLRLHGVASLHASVVELDRRAVVLAGAAGMGKSMTAATLARRGIKVMSDDVAPLFEKSGRFFVHSGYPRVRLWPSAVRALYGSEEALPLLTPNWDKRYLSLQGPEGNFHPGPLPLGAIYLLDNSLPEPGVRVTALEGQEALIELVANTYTSYLPDRKMRAREFQLLGEVTSGVPIRRLRFAPDSARVDELCDRLVSDFGKTRSGKGI